MKVWLGVFLCIHGLLDGVTGYIYLPVIVLQIVVGVVVGNLQELSVQLLLLRFFPGLFALLISLCSRGALGQGDAWIFLAVAPYLTVEEQIGLFFCASLLAGLWTMCRFCIRTVDKNTEIVFAPFICAGYLGGWYVGLF